MTTVATQTIQIQEISRVYIMLQKGAVYIPDKYNELLIQINKTVIQFAYELLEKEIHENKFLQ